MPMSFEIQNREHSIWFWNSKPFLKFRIPNLLWNSGYQTLIDTYLIFWKTKNLNGARFQFSEFLIFRKANPIFGIENLLKDSEKCVQKNKPYK